MSPVKLTHEEAIARVNQVMVEVFEAEEESLRREARLAEDLDLDSLDGVDLVIALEKTFGCKLSEEEARGIRTMGDIYDKILERLEELEEAEKDR